MGARYEATSKRHWPGQIQLLFGDPPIGFAAEAVERENDRGRTRGPVTPMTLDPWLSAPKLAA